MVNSGLRLPESPNTELHINTAPEKAEYMRQLLTNDGIIITRNSVSGNGDRDTTRPKVEIFS